MASETSGETVKRVLVWGRWIRICHWALALSVTVLIASGWILENLAGAADMFKDIHFVASAVLIAAFSIRIYLLFFASGSEHWSSLTLNRHRLRQSAEVLKFYFSLGKFPLPNWFAHNPIWAPIYLLLFIVLGAQIGSGLLLLNDTTLLAGVSLRSLHQTSSMLITSFFLLHMLAVFVHDLKGKSAEVSGMINGYKIFIVPGEKPDQGSVTSISLNELTSKLPSKN